MSSAVSRGTRAWIALAVGMTMFAAGCTSSPAESAESGDSSGAATQTMVDETVSDEAPGIQDTASGDTPSDGSDSPSSGQASSGAPSANAESPNAQLNAAANTALGSLPDVTLTSIESENNDTQWEVKLIDTDGEKYKIVISRDGGTIDRGPEQQKTSGADKAKYLKRVAGAELTHADAVDALAKEMPDGQIDELELDTEGGVLVWEADVYDSAGAEHSFNVDAATGEVTRDD